MNKSDLRFYLISAGVILVLMGWWFVVNEQLFFRTSYVVKVVDAGGMAPGSPVWVNGPIHGEVVGVSETNDGHALLNIELERGVELTTSATVVVRSKGMVGKRVLDIQLAPGGTPYLEGDTIVGEFERGPVHLVVFAQEFFKGLIDAVDVLGKSYRATLGDSLQQEKFAQLEVGLIQLGSRIQRLSRKYTKEIPETVGQGMAALERLGQEGKEIHSELKPLLREIKFLRSELEVWNSQLAIALAPVADISESLKQGKGSLGQVLTNEEFQTQWSQFKRNLDSLASVFNQGETVINADIF